MQTRIHIAPCREDQVGLLRAFIDAHWRKGHILSRDETLLRWQHDRHRMRTVDLEGPTVLLAWEADRLVGMLGVIPASFNLHGRIVQGVWLGNLLAVPEARPKGVGLKLLWAVQAWGLGAVCDLGSNEVSRRIFSALKYEVLDDVPRWVGVFDLPKMVQLLVDAAPGFSRGTVEETCAALLVARKQNRFDEVEVEVVDGPRRFGQEWDAFWTECLAPDLICTHRDAQHLNWRYVDHPRFSYEFRLARSRSGGILGLAVFRVEQVRDRTERVLRLVEFLATAEAQAALAAAVLQAGLEHSVTFADFYCTSAAVASALERVGFCRQVWAEDKPAIPTRLQPLEAGYFRMAGAFRLSAAIRNEVGPLLSEKGFYVTKSDGDMDRPN